MEKMENQQRESMKQFKDIFHEHHQPLVLNQEPPPWDHQSKEIPCSACNDLLSGESYSCPECEFHLHKRCAEAPFQINHPLHRDHLLTLQASSSIANPNLESSHCLICCRIGTRFVYLCSFCGIVIDIKCAIYTVLDETVLDSHEHPLFPVDDHPLPRLCAIQWFDCDICREVVLDSRCVCSTCSFCAHKECAELPPKISHPCHHLHSLFLESSIVRDAYCSVCYQRIRGLIYSCSSCDLHIHRDCVWPNPVIKDESHHEHPFNLFWKQDPFICNACGNGGKSVSYVCVTCHLQVHQSCISLPRFIKFERHRHPLSHHYFLKNIVENDEKIYCRYCFDEVKIEHGSYRSLGKGCNYVLHVKCVIDGRAGYEEIDANEIEDLLKDKPVEPSITVVEVNEFGEAVKFKHFLHDHNELMLEDKIKEVDDHYKQCDGCVDLVFSAPFYYCSHSQCNFMLHKSCAELPKMWDGWLFAYPFTLKSDGIFRCTICGHRCSGFSYYYDDKIRCFDFCLRCARISDTFRYSGHQHFLYYDVDDDYYGNCIACGHGYPTFRCKHDNVALDFRCMTLPVEAKHKCDKHVLKLTYGDESKDPTQHVCDVCEEERDPHLWFYCCSICNNSAHPKCVLGEYPLIKIGSMYNDEDVHEHPLTSVQKIYYYPKCAKCGKHCLDLSLECATCNYIVHWSCTKFRLI